MNRRAVEQAKAEALRFIGKCDELLASTYQTYISDASGNWGYEDKPWDGSHSRPCPESATVRRASMDLTRQLAKLRKR